MAGQGAFEASQGFLGPELHMAVGMTLIVVASARCLCNAWAGLFAVCAHAWGCHSGGWTSVTVQHPILLYNLAPSPTAFHTLVPIAPSHPCATSHRFNRPAKKMVRSLSASLSTLGAAP